MVTNNPNKDLKKDLVILFMSLILTTMVVGFMFSHSTNHFKTGLTAGTIFIVIGLRIISLALIYNEVVKTIFFWLGGLHFMLSITLFVTRIIYHNIGFESSTVLGIPGPFYHRLSSLNFGLLAVFVLVKIFRLKKEITD